MPYEAKILLALCACWLAILPYRRIFKDPPEPVRFGIVGGLLYVTISTLFAYLEATTPE